MFPWKPISPSFLIERLQTARRIEMGNKSYVGLVNSHAKRNGRDQDQIFLLSTPESGSA